MSAIVIEFPSHRTRTASESGYEHMRRWAYSHFKSLQARERHWIACQSCPHKPVKELPCNPQ